MFQYEYYNCWLDIPREKKDTIDTKIESSEELEKIMCEPTRWRKPPR